VSNGPPRRQVQGAASPLAGAVETMASLSGAASRAGLDTAAALTSLTAARRLAADLEQAELALIEAASHLKLVLYISLLICLFVPFGMAPANAGVAGWAIGLDGGATWSQIAAALGASNRQTAQKRHADLSRRWSRPPPVDTPTATETPATTPPAGAVHEAGGTLRETGHDGHAASTHDPGAGNPAALARTSAPAENGSRGEAGRPRRARSPATCEDAGLPPQAAPSAGGGRRAAPKITDAIIAEGRYEIVRAPGHAETRAWHVLVSGMLAGLVRPTWRGERSRPGWEPVDAAGTAMPATGIGRTTSAGNARTRDAAAVSLLRALQRQQQEARKKAAR